MKGLIKRYFGLLFSLLILLCAASCVIHTSDFSQVEKALLLKTQRVWGWFFLSPELYLLSAEGKGEIDASIPAKIGDDPEWSPDGKWVVFVKIYGRGQEEKSDIYLMRSDGSLSTRVVEHTERGNYYPTWLPDGKHIAFSRGVGGSVGGSDIYELDVSCILQAERNCRLNSDLTIKNGNAPDWSSDGKRVAYVDNSISADMGRGVYVRNEQGNTIDVTPLDDGVCHSPTWSPDGTKLLMECSLRIYVMNPDGSQNIEIGVGYHPEWSPDGKQIAFTSSLGKGLGICLGLSCGWDDGYYSEAIFVMNSDGSEVTRLSLRADEAVTWFEWLPNGY